MSRSEGNIDTSHRFTGQELDPETGLYYYGGRYYDAEIGRFVSPDPYVQEPEDPQSLNRYSYTLNSPQHYVDPDGFFWQTFLKIFAGLLAGAGGQASATAAVDGPSAKANFEDNAAKIQENLDQARSNIQRLQRASHDDLSPSDYKSLQTDTEKLKGR